MLVLLCAASMGAVSRPALSAQVPVVADPAVIAADTTARPDVPAEPG